MSDPTPESTTCLTCGTPITAGVLGGKCPTCLKKVALMEPTLMDDTLPVAAPTPSPPVIGWIQPSVEEVAAMLPKGFYTVERFIGRGGMGAVYQGTQTVLNRPVAIKIMRQDHAMDAEFRLRFLREAQTLARMTHPGIVNVIDCGEAGPNFLFIVMEFVEGTDLAEVLDTRDMDEATALQLIPQICEALQFAHDNGIIHRDIKPSNILLTHDGRVKIADFGLAKLIDAGSLLLTRSDVGMGTPDYAAPEQFTPGATVDFRADIYALGVLIYRVLTGKLPQGAWKLPSQTTSVNPEWDKVVKQAMQPRPEDRYASASEVKADVVRLSTMQASLASALPASITRLLRLVATPWAAAAALVSLLVLGWLAKVSWDSWSSAAHQAPRGWIDATSEVKQQMLRNGLCTVKDGLIYVTKAGTVILADDRIINDVAIRVTMQGCMKLVVRSASALTTSAALESVTGGGHRTVLFQYDNDLRRSTGFAPQKAMLDRSFDLEKDHELVIAARGSEASYWLDGKLMHRTDKMEVLSGGIGLLFMDPPTLSGYLAKVSKVEYIDLATSPTIGDQYLPASKPDNNAWIAQTRADVPALKTDASARTDIELQEDKWTDLLPQIDPNRDAIRGTWDKTKEGLVCASPLPWSLCSFPINEPDDDYDLRFRVTRGEGSHLAMFFLFRKNGVGGYAPVDYIDGSKAEFSDQQRGAGLENVGPSMYAPGGLMARRPEWLSKGRTSTVLLQVRAGWVRLLVDGEEAWCWPADWSKLKQGAGTGGALFTNLPTRPFFGVGIYNCAAKFHQIEMRKAPVNATETAPTVARTALQPVSPTYPEPKSWVDATETVRAGMLSTDGAEVSGDWLHVPHDASVRLSKEGSFDDVALRATYKGQLYLALRHQLGHHYVATFDHKRAGIYYWVGDPEHFQPTFARQWFSLPNSDWTQEHIATFVAKGPWLSLWIDGKLIGTQYDDTLSSGDMEVQIYGVKDETDHAWIKKIEYGVLDGPPTPPR